VTLVAARPWRLPVVSFALLVVIGATWALATPPMAGPDEPSHQRKAAAVVRGQLRDDLDDDGRSARVEVPRPLRTDPTCFAFKPDEPADCMEVVEGPGDERMGHTAIDYPPTAYVVLGLPSLVHDGVGILWAQRLVGVVVAAGLLALAVAAAGRTVAAPDRPTALAGLAVALTPMSLFLIGVVNPSGWAIAAGAAAWAGGYALARVAPADRLGRAVLATAGPLCLLVLVRRDTWLWGGVVGLGIAALVPPTRWPALVRSRAVWAGFCAVALSIGVQAVAFTGGLGVRIGDGATTTPQRAGPGIAWAWGSVRTLASQQVGHLGWIDTSLPVGVHVLVGALVVATLVFAVRVGPRRPAAVAVAVAVVDVAVWLGLESYRPGYSHGRYLLPIAVGAPIVAGLAAAEGRVGSDRRTPSWWPTVALVGVAVVEVVSWWVNLRRYAVGASGPWWFPPGAAWSPPLPMLSLLVANVLAMVGLITLWSRSSSPALPPGRPAQRVRRHRRPVATGLVVLVVLLAVGGCGDGGDDGDGAVGGDRPGGSSVPAVTTPVPFDRADRPDGPTADLSEVITGSGAPFLGSAVSVELPDTYLEQELVAAGEATAYRAVGELGSDGDWTFEPDTTAPYRTRVVVRRPSAAADFSGTVVVEWLNVSGGLDADPDWASLHEEITRQGHAWIGVSAQMIGVEGGAVLVAPPGVGDLAGKGLKALVPERYGSLGHPGDGYAFDIFTQVARAARGGGAPLGDLPVEVVLAAGESQSAIALTTYYNGVQPLTEAFDGFFVHSRAFAALPLVGAGEAADLAGGMASNPEAVRLRGDLAAPVIELQAEGDVVGLLNSSAARQDDTDRFRLWEVAGTAHADAHLIGALADVVDCGVPINDGPLHLVAKAALRSLDTWVRTGAPPPKAPRLSLTAITPPAIERDADSLAVGGIRTPPVDVPVDVLTGETLPDVALFCLLMGSTTPLPEARLVELYPDRAAYLERFESAADGAIAAGFVLDDDRDALLGYARPERLN
jgi:hypothetical protein